MAVKPRHHGSSACYNLGEYSGNGRRLVPKTHRIAPALRQAGFSLILGLAEASPDSFLEAIQSLIAVGGQTVVDVFGQESAGISGRTYITGMLWGLEALAWEDAFLVSVCGVLADLAAIDPGGNWSNRPANSLTAILLPWLPHTCAPTEKRHAAVKVVAKRADVGWNLIFSLLPETHGFSSGTHKPKWRSAVPPDWGKSVPKSQYWEDVLSYGRLAVEMAGNESEKIVKLVERYFRLPEEIRLSLRARLTSNEVQALPESERFQIWAALTQLTTNHRKFSKSDIWKVPEGALEALDAIADILRPTSPEIRHRRLFAGRDSDLYERLGEFETEQMQLEEKRRQAVAEIISKGGLALLLEFTYQVESPWEVGSALGSLSHLTRDDDILPALLETDSKALLKFTNGFVWSRYRSVGWSWVDSVNTDEWSDKTKGQFFRFLPFCEETWSRVSRHMGRNDEEYWKNTSANPFEASTNLGWAMEKLLTYDRADAVINCIHLVLNRVDIEPDLALRALERWHVGNRIDAYAIGEVFTFLQGRASVSEARLRQMERKFLPLLGEFHSGQPISLSRWMAEDPEFFCEVIRTVYRSTKDEKEAEVTEELRTKATNAYHLLQEWRIPPGTRRDGSFDDEALKCWVEAVKTMCIETGHWEVAASQVGEVLYYAPRDENGLWTRSVCLVLEEKDHSQLRSGLTMKIANERGVFTYTAGKEEMALAGEWSRIASRAEDEGFPLLGQALRRVADSYKRDAERDATRNPYERI